MDIKSLEVQEEVIEYNKQIILCDSACFRVGIWDDFFKGLGPNIFVFLWYYFKTYYCDIRTKWYYKNLTRKPDYWISIRSNGYEELEEHCEWLAEQKIKYDNLWYNYSTNTLCAFIFKHREDAMAFKLKWT